MITGIDHTLSVAADLEATAALYRKLGFTLTPRGRHIGWGTANYCIMFADDYLELLGIVDASQFVNGLNTQLDSRGPGVSGLAFATDNAAQAHAMLEAHGLSDRLADLSRLVELDSGDTELHFRLAYPKPGSVPALSGFIVEHLSKDIIRQAAWLEHPNGTVGVEGMTIIHDDPASLEAGYVTFLSALEQPLDRLHRGEGRLDVPIGARQSLRFLTPTRAARRYPGIDAALLNRPGPLVITLAVASLDDTAHYLAQADIPILSVPGERLVIDPAYTDGTIIEFAAS